MKRYSDFRSFMFFGVSKGNCIYILFIHATVTTTYFSSEKKHETYSLRFNDVIKQ